MPISRTLTVYADLIEGSRTNLCIQSSAFNNWATKTDVTITDAALTPGDGTGSASRVLEGSAGTAAVTSAAMTIAAGRIVTSCVRFKFKATNSWVMVTVASDTLANGWSVWANVNTGVVGTQSAIGTGTVVGTPTLTALGSGEYLLCSMGKVAAAATSCQISVNSASADTSTTRVNAADYYAWGAQVEMMAASATTGNPSTLITTTTVAVTRAADVLTVPYVLAQTGTILALCVPYGWTGDQDGVTNYIAFRCDDTNNSRMQRANSTIIQFHRPDAGGLETTSLAHGFTNGALTHCGGVWDSASVRGTVNGVATTPDATLTPPFNTNTVVSIGGNSGVAAFFGHVALLAWPRALSASELLAIYNQYPSAA
jgi:hypothetical protein